MKLWYCENYVEAIWCNESDYIELFYIIEDPLGYLTEFDEQGHRLHQWEDWDDYFSTWKDQKYREKNFIKVRVL